MEYPDIIYTKEGHIATITLNRPDRLNAFSLAMIDSIQRALVDAGSDGEIRAIIITGAGRGFCAGMDMKVFPNIGAVGSAGADVGRGLSLPSIALGIDKPIIASINGAAIGWGLELALLCDIRIAAESAKIGDLHVNRSVMADNGGLYLLPRLVGWARACEIYFCGQIIDGKEAERIGLVNKAVPLEKLGQATREMADNIAKQAPMAVQLGKRAMRNALNSSLEASQDYVYSIVRYLLQSEDFGEAMKAFIEGREARFKGG